MKPIKRTDNMKQVRKRKRGKYMSRFTLFVSLVFIVVTIGIGSVIYMKYQSTEKWDDTSLNAPQADVPPEFAKNTYTPEMLKDIKALSVVTKTLAKVDADKGLTKETIDEARTSAATSEAILKAYNITGGEAIDNQNLLKLYIDVYDVQQTAYKSPDSEKLSHITNALYKQNLKSESETNKALMASLDTIAQNYGKLNAFIEKTIPMIGTVDKNIVQVQSALTENQTDEIVQQINSENLDMFPNIAKVKKELTSDAWIKILQSNKNAMEKSAWNKTLAMFKALSKSQYYEVENVTTLKDAKKAGFTILGADSKPGFELLDMSPVVSVTVGGQAVKAGQFVCKDVSISVTINPTYKQIATTETTTSSSSSTHTETSSSSTSEQTQSSESETNPSTPTYESETDRPSTTESSSESLLPEDNHDRVETTE